MVTVPADRGFGDQKLYRWLTDNHFDYAIRFRECIQVTDAKGTTKPAADWVPANGAAKLVPNAQVTGDAAAIPAVVCVKKRGMKDAWCMYPSA